MRDPKGTRTSVPGGNGASAAYVNGASKGKGNKTEMRE
jgi:hypothetical protein